MKEENDIIKSAVKATAKELTTEEKKEKIRNSNYKSKYGITVEHYEAIKDKQEGCCKICNTKTDELVVDHCHTTNRVRGLLCTHCNLGLGHWRDNPETITAALVYLQESRYYEVSGIKLPIKEFCKTPIFKIEKIK
jgi:N12 class adenine-specific DNA methylase